MERYGFEGALAPEEMSWLDPRDDMVREPGWLDRFHLDSGWGKGHLSAEGHR
jgi:hypothetical protein